MKGKQYIIKERIDSGLYKILKDILAVKKITKQQIVLKAVQDFVLSNYNLIGSNDKNGK